jgi:steroid delta-isomerase-like uncharacterized protein
MEALVDSYNKRSGNVSPKAIVKDYLEAWNNRDYERMRGLMHRDYTYAGGDGQEQKGPEAGLAVSQMFARAFPDGRIDVVSMKEAGDTVLVEFIGRGTHRGDLMGIAPTGRPITIPVCEVFELRDGKIYREREYMDMVTIMVQVGVTRVPLAAPA